MMCCIVKNDFFVACSHKFIANACCAFLTVGLVKCLYCSIAPWTVIRARLCGCFDVSSPRSPPLPIVAGVLKSD